MKSAFCHKVLHSENKALLENTTLQPAQHCRSHASTILNLKQPEQCYLFVLTNNLYYKNTH